MQLVYTFLAEGFEEVEALTVVDLLKRAAIDTKMVSISDRLEVTGSHGITVKADMLFEETDMETATLLFLPGGMPGTSNLAAHEGLKSAVTAFHSQGKRLAAICAAPSIFGEMGILEGRKATCYPGYEKVLRGAICDSAGAVTDGHITTGKGMGTAIAFGLELITQLKGKEISDDIAEKIQYS